MSAVGLVLGVLGGLTGVAWAGYRFATTSPRFSIQSITLHGNQHLTADHIIAALPVALGDNVFTVDLATITRALRANPWIADAAAHRILPDTIRIDVQEHHPVALADLGGLYLVDESGHPFKRAVVEAGEAVGLPVVTGISRARFTENPQEGEKLIGSALEMLDLWRGNTGRPQIGEIHVSPFGALTFRTYDVATAIQLGVIDSGLRGRFQRFDTTWAELGETERAHARAIHVDSHSDRVTVAFEKDQ